MSTIIGLVSTFRLPLQLTFLLDFLLSFLHLNVQSATLQFHATLCITFPPHSPSSFEYSILEYSMKGAM